MRGDRLRIYLSDHAAMMTAEEELAERCLKENRGQSGQDELVQLLEELVREIHSQREMLHIALKSMDAGPDVVKEFSGWLVEKMGRLKWNGQISGYSPLSRVLELETLLASVQIRLAFWKGARKTSVSDPLPTSDIQVVIDSTTGLLARLEEQHQKACVVAFNWSE